MDPSSNSRIDPTTFISTVETMTGLERSTIHRKVKADQFPRPFYVSRRRAWLRSQVEEWLKAQQDKGTPPPAPPSRAA